MTTVFVGIDVSKDRLETQLRPDEAGLVHTNDANGIDALTETLKTIEPRLIVLEATGGYERAVAAALAAAGLPVAVVNPRQVRDSRPIALTQPSWRSLPNASSLRYGPCPRPSVWLSRRSWLDAGNCSKCARSSTIGSWWLTRP